MVNVNDYLWMIISFAHMEKRFVFDSKASLHAISMNITFSNFTFNQATQSTAVVEYDHCISAER